MGHPPKCSFLNGHKFAPQEWVLGVCSPWILAPVGHALVATWRGGGNAVAAGASCQAARWLCSSLVDAAGEADDDEEEDAAALA